METAATAWRRISRLPGLPAAARGPGRRAARLPEIPWRRRRVNEHGAVAVLVALLLPMVIGMAMLVVDVGSVYLTRAQLQGAADAAALAGAQDLPNSPTTAQADARSYAAKNVSGATVTPVTPYSGDSTQIQVTVSESSPMYFGSYFGISRPTITASAVAQHTPGTSSVSVYAASTACSAITIDGFLNAPTIWSNGGVLANGPTDTVGVVDIGQSSCPFSSQLRPPGPTNVGNYTGWPIPLPTVAQGNYPSSCPSAPINIISGSWISAHPPGIYCSTSSITINVAGVNFNGYEFVSIGTGAIIVDNSGDTFTGVGTPRTVFYSTAGGVTINQTPCTITGNIFAPAQPVIFDGGVTVTGSVEASQIVFNSGSSTITGTGATGSSGTVSLIG